MQLKGRWKPFISPSPLPACCLESMHSCSCRNWRSHNHSDHKLETMYWEHQSYIIEIAWIPETMELPPQLFAIGCLTKSKIDFCLKSLFFGFPYNSWIHFLLTTVSVLLVGSIENPSLLVQVFQEVDSKTGLNVQRIYWEKTPMKDKREKSRNSQGKPSRHDVGLTPVKRVKKNGVGRI